MKTRTLQYRVLLLLFALLFLFFLCGDFGIPSLAETAVITAVGVEKGVDENFLATFVVAKSEKGERVNNILQTEGDTVSGCVNRLKSEYGVTPKLAYTSVVLVEKDLASGGIFNVISFFLNTNGVHDSASLLVCDVSPKDVFSAEVEGEKSGYDAFVKIMKSGEGTPFAMPKVNLKDFAENYFTVGVDTAIGKVAVENGKPRISGGYLFSGDKIAVEVGEEDVLFLNMLKNKGEKGSFLIKDVKVSDVITDIRLGVVDCSCKVDKKLKMGVANVAVSCDLKVSLLDQSVSDKSLFQVCGVDTDKNAIASEVESYIEKGMRELIENAFESGSDFLGVGEYLNRKNEGNFEYVNVGVDVKADVLQNGRM